MEAGAHPRIGIISGAGRLGETIGKLWVKAGYHVLFGARHPSRLTELIREAGPGARPGTLRQAALFGDVVLLACHFPRIEETLAATGPMEAKIIIDATNPFHHDSSGLALPEGTTAASELAKKIPKARIVKAFNTPAWETLALGAANPAGRRLVVCCSANEEAAKQEVARLIEAAGFAPFDLGPLASASLQEPYGPFFGRELTPEQAERLLRGLGRPSQEAA